MQGQDSDADMEVVGNLVAEADLHSEVDGAAAEAGYRDVDSDADLAMVVDLLSDLDRTAERYPQRGHLLMKMMRGRKTLWRNIYYILYYYIILYIICCCLNI
jgi:hypothetical protein